MLKLQTILIALLILYPTVELTRVIFAWGIEAEYILEMIIYWGCYIAAVTLIGFWLCKDKR